MAADHSVVDPAVSLQAAGLEDGDHLTAIAVEARLAATDRAFALFCCGGDQVVTWGHPDYGGDSSRSPRISSRASSRFRHHVAHLLLSLPMGRS